MSIYDFSANDINGIEHHFNEFTGFLLLIVNTASKYGNKTELIELQKLQESFEGRKFQILAFPCRQFLKQESKDKNKIIHRYIDKCKVSFKIFELTKVNGHNTIPVYKWLKNKSNGNHGSSIDWNFTKFLVSSDGCSVMRISSFVGFNKLHMIIDEELKKIENNLEKQNDISN